MRIACLLIPDLPLRAELQAHPERLGLPVAIAFSRDPRAEIIASSPEARRAGVLPGMRATHARTLCPDLHLTAASPERERCAHGSLLDIALSFSPRAAASPQRADSVTGEAAVFLDATGVSSLFRSEAGFAAAIGLKSQALGLQGVTAVASSRNIALIAARQLVVAPLEETARSSNEGACVVVAPGGEAAFLAPLPIDLLDPGDRLMQRLSRLGIRRVRELLRVPEHDLAQRFGAEAVQLAARARGLEPELPLPRHSDTRMREGEDFEYAMDRLEPLLFVLRGLLTRLIKRLKIRNLSCGSVDFQLELSGGGKESRQVKVAAPTNDVRILLRLISLALESHPPSGPVEGASLTTTGSAARTDQLDLFRPAGPDPATLDRTLNELETLCGAGRVGAPEVPDDPRPGAFGISPFRSHNPAKRDAATDPASLQPQAPTRGRLAVRALRPPVSASVRTEKGLPAELRSAVASGRILQVAGPWRTTGRWWSEDRRFATDHFDVQVNDGTVLRLCFDWMNKEWHVDAVYD
jgi:protein ImuB